MKVTKDQILNFAMSTAKRFGWCGRATLSNKTGETCWIHVIVRRENGELLKRAEKVTEIINRDVLVIDLPELCQRLNIAQPEHDLEELIFTFSMVPKSLGDQESYEIDRKQLTQWLHAQDHYAEYYDPKTGFAGGVNYAISPMNDPVYSPRSSNLVQAPKVVVSESENTIFQMIFFSSDVAAQREIKLWCTLRKPNGEKVAQWQEKAALHSLLWVDIKQRLKQEGLSWPANGEEFLYFQAYSREAAFACLALNVNEKTGCFAYEHSLSADYYFSTFRGDRKAQVLEFIEKNILFAPAAS